jgi:sortase A
MSVKPPRSPVRAAARRGGAALIWFGLVVIFFGFYELVGTGAMTAHAQHVLRAEFTVPAPAPTPTSSVVPAPRAGQPVARLQIPRIGLDVIVVEGIDASDLAKGPGHYPGTAPIGGQGATAIAGHSSGWGAPFMHVGRLHRGDLIVLRTAYRTFTYRVTSTEVVAPTAVQVLSGDPHSLSSHKLVLTTCWPLFTHRQRLIVFADLAA